MPFYTADIENNRSASNIQPLLNTTSKRIFFNRLPKCGSSSLNELIAALSLRHKFLFIRSRIYMTFHVSEQDQDTLTRRFTNTKAPMLFERHIHFIDFTRYV